jgi:hypothetical protein
MNAFADIAASPAAHVQARPAILIVPPSQGTSGAGAARLRPGGDDPSAHDPVMVHRAPHS